MIEAKVIADSINLSTSRRITTMLLTYPRFIHSELMTHRMFSRNAASSRAIPVEKMIKTVADYPAGPAWWGKNQAGMRANEHLGPQETESAKWGWFNAAEDAVYHARHLLQLGVHKQIANRVLEPFQWMTTLVTATDFENFFALRAHPDAQPEFQVLAYEMLDAYLASEPVQKWMNSDDKFKVWHIPFGDRMPEGLDIQTALKVATAQCARLSYLTFDGEINVEKDVALHDRLAESGHWSPFEHCAQPTPDNEYTPNHTRATWGNFEGWAQYRKEFPTERRTADLKMIQSATGVDEKFSRESFSAKGKLDSVHAPTDRVAARSRAWQGSERSVSFVEIPIGSFGSSSQ